MDEYSDETRYTITFEQGGYTHKVKGDAWITMDFTAAAISASAGKAQLVNNFNGAEAAFRDGVKIWSDYNVPDKAGDYVVESR